jgi:CSLREA domain-containing protein
MLWAHTRRSSVGKKNSTTTARSRRRGGAVAAAVVDALEMRQLLTAFNSTGAIQTYTVPTTGTYSFNLAGAQGGTGQAGGGGDGEDITGYIALTAGEQLKVVVGGMGATGAANAYGGGGGGGSFVFVSGASQPLIVAGGGGGAGWNTADGGSGQSGTAGQNGSGAHGGAGGTAGSGGGVSSTGAEDGGGGGGYLGNGKGVAGAGDGVGGDGPPTFAGGAGYGTNAGGFGGGGGGGYQGGGGGGGYSGGGGADGVLSYGGGGGGSYTDSSITGATFNADQTGNGSFEITPASLVVTSTSDSPTATGNTLREAIAYANSLTGSQTVTFASALTSGGPATITLTNGELDITGSLTITGPGANELTVDGDNNSEIFVVNSQTQTIQDVAITGLTLTDAPGAIDDSEDLTLGGDDISNNTGSGVTIESGATLTSSGDAFVGNVESQFGAGGILNYGTFYSSNDTFSGNSGPNGGAIFSEGTGTLTNDTITQNHAVASFPTTGYGGGVLVLTGTLTIANTIIAGNSADVDNPDVS